MQVCKLLLLFKIFVSTHGNEVKVNDKQRSVNLALETVLEFNHKDNSADIQFLDNVQKFIKKVRGVIDRKISRRDFRSGKNENFTDFIQAVISILNTYNEQDLQDVFDILDDEIRKYHYRGCKFYELTENYEIRKIMASKLDLIRGQPIEVIRGFINGLAVVLKEQDYDKYVKDVMDYINSLYRHDSTEKFNKVLTNLEEFNKSKTKKSITNLVKIVRGAVRTVIFDHYTGLNPNARRELKSKIEVLLKQYKQAPLTKSYSYKENIKTDKKSDNIFIDTTFVEPAKKVEPNTLNVFNNKEEAAYLDINERSDRGEREKEERAENEKEIERESEIINSKSYESKNDISKSDYEKKIGKMRDGMKEVTKYSHEKNRAWLPKYTTLDSNQIDSPEYSDAKPKKVPRSYQRTTKRHYRTGRTFSSDDKISEDVGTVEDNSIEFHAEELMTTRPRSVKSDTQRFITLWEETATGGIPQYILDQLTTKKHKSHKKKHKSKHKEQKTHKIKKLKKHKKRQEHERQKDSETTHKTKLRNKRKKKNKPIIISEHNADIAVRSTAMENYDPKKILEPARIGRIQSENSWPEGYIQVPSPRGSQNNSWYDSTTAKNLSKLSTSATETSTMAKKSIRRIHMSLPEKYGNRYQVLPLSSLRDFRKSGTSQASREGLSIEHIPHTEKKKTKKSYNDTQTVVLDVNVMKRIKELEREIKEVRSKMGDRNIGKAGNDKAKVKKHDSKNKRRSRVVKNSPTEEKKNYKLKPDQEAKFKAEIKVNPIADDTTTKLTETYYTTTYETTAKETRSTDNPKIVVQRKTDDPDRIVVNDDIRHEEGAMRLVNQDTPNPVFNYDEVDEWKDAFKINSKNRNLKTTTKSSTKSSTISSTKPSTKSSSIPTITTTILTTTTPKPTETVTTSPNKVEIFIPVSMPSVKTTVTKTFTTKKMEQTQDIHIPFDESFKMKSPNSLSALLVSPFAASNNFNYSNSFNARENVKNEVSFMLKKNNISVPTDRPKDNNMLATNLNDASLPFNRMRKDISFTPATDDLDFGNNTLEGGLLFTDPFQDINDELDFLKV